MSTPAPVPARYSERAHPHGLLGYVLADPERTRNALRLAPAVVLALGIVATAVVVFAVAAPIPAAVLLGGGSSASLVGVAVRRWQHRRGTRRDI